ncbi:hypothetical protein B4100_0259 [Heyndrickxia coagulans]|nr:hypothetical protein B4100_0259 [Heyndrickxia coagulans]
MEKGNPVTVGEFFPEGWNGFRENGHSGLLSVSDRPEVSLRREKHMLEERRLEGRP